MPPRPRSLEARFWPKVEKRKPDECWEWRGKCERAGYGILVKTSSPYKTCKTHRLSWELHFGPIPGDLCVLHHCDNPPCCNPSHLYLGTRADNNRDRAIRRRGKEQRQRGAANDNAKLREADVKVIVDALAAGCRQTDLAEAFGVSQPQVSRIARRESWAHLWDE